MIKNILSNNNKSKNFIKFNDIIFKNKSNIELLIDAHYPKLYQTHFIQSVANNILPGKVFIDYLKQDEYYIFHYNAVWIYFMNRMKIQYPIEHVSLLKTYSISLNFYDDFYAGDDSRLNVNDSITPSPETLSYTHFIKQVRQEENAILGIMALSPCLYIYNKLAKDMLPYCSNNNIYKDWLMNYSDDKYSDRMENLMTTLFKMYVLLDEDTQKKADNYITQALNMELLFFSQFKY